MNKSAILLATLIGGIVLASNLHAASSYSYATLAGSSDSVVKSTDATGSAAQFNAPRGVAVDSSGTLYIADSSNHSIRKVTAAGVVTTLAGTAGTAGAISALPAKFNEPFGIAVDSSGTIYVADTNNNAIRKITSAGTVSTLAGGNGMGTTDGSGTSVKFSEPHGVAVDGSGNVYVTDYMNHTVRKVTPAGVVSTLAGSAGNEGFTNGQGTAAKFKSLQGIAVDTSGNIYVADAGNRSIRKITSSGLVTTLADGSNGQFGEPRGVAVDTSGNVYVADYSSNTIYKVTSGGTVSKISGTPPTAGSTDGSSALFNAPSGIAVDSSGNLYVADTLNNTLRKISGGTVTTLAGMAGRSSSADGKGTAARFEDPYAVASDGKGTVYVADATDHSIRKIASDGTVTTLAGKAGTFGSNDGTGTAALFKTPQGIAADSSGNVYVADTGNYTVRKITAAGVVTTLAGAAGQPGSNDGTGTAARFKSPYGVAVDSSGNVYVVDAENSNIRKITASGVVTTLAGSAGSNGLIDGTGTAAKFSVPFDLAVDASGNIYVCDHGNHAIRKVTPAGVVTTLAGSGAAGNADGNGRSATFKYPAGIAVDNSGYVYVADTDNQVLRRISPTGDVTTIGGSGAVGSSNATGTSTTFYNPKDVAVDNAGNVYVVDRGNHLIRKGTLQTSISNTVSDCIFDWAEKTYPGFLSPSSATSYKLTETPYYYRYYSGTGNYLGTSSDDLHLYFLGKDTGGNLLDIGLVSDFKTKAGCQ